MKQAVGHTPMYMLIATFLVIIFAFLAAIISYYKAFKLNSRISSVIEKCEGYNDCSREQINIIVRNFGYNVKQNQITCPKKEGGELLNITTDAGICLYYFEDDVSNKRYSYGVITYMMWDLPLIKELVKLPIFSKTDRLYKF